jgi:hypothetical protein
MPPLKDKAGNKYGLLLVLRRIGKTGHTALWECQCDCGNTVTVSDRNLGVTSRTTKSCGCLKRTHEKSKTPEYTAYSGAKNRCTNLKADKYEYYGGRGIRFLYESFEEFWLDVGPRPSPKYTLERINNNGNYERGNCKWATRAEQLKNRRKTLRIEQFSDKELIFECQRRGLFVPNDEYLGWDDLLHLISNSSLKRLYEDHTERIAAAPGSSHNHQAWVGGYRDHVVECMNIARILYVNSPRIFPFTLSDALLVMALHDLEKPWKHLPVPNNVCLCSHVYADHDRTNPWSDAACNYCTGVPRNCNMFRHVELKTKEDRRAFRDGMIEEYGILLSDDQKNALKYVEGIPDKEYKPGDRIMGELAAFCHSCDILSARLWYDWGKEHSWTR